MGYLYDPGIGRYRDRTGRLVSLRAVRVAVDNACDLAARRMAGHAGGLLDGSLSLAEWQRRMMADLKAAHIAAGVAAHGGRAQMRPAGWGLIGARIRSEYRYLAGFAADIASGRQPLNGSLMARARMYGQAARPTFEAFRAVGDRARGATVERNVLHAAEHCQECRELAARGWVPVGTLPPIGRRRCRANDRCTIERRVAAPAP